MAGVVCTQREGWLSGGCDVTVTVFVTATLAMKASGVTVVS